MTILQWINESILSSLTTALLYMERNHHGGEPVALVELCVLLRCVDANPKCIITISPHHPTSILNTSHNKLTAVFPAYYHLEANSVRSMPSCSLTPNIVSLFTLALLTSLPGKHLLFLSYTGTCHLPLLLQSD